MLRAESQKLISADEKEPTFAAFHIGIEAGNAFSLLFIRLTGV